MATTQQNLDDARSAYHKLMTGGSVAEFADSNGERVKYFAANKATLAAYIASLEADLIAPSPCAGPGPMRLFWS